METISVRVPTKVTFFGEHAVVYGVPAIASTIPVYIDIVGGVVRDNNTVTLHVKQGLQVIVNTITVGREGIVIGPEPNYLRRILSYTLTALSICEEFIGVKGRSHGYYIAIDSPLPAGVGLGTSAAISVGVLTLCLKLNNYIDDVEGCRHEIAKLAWSVEKSVQGSASPMDTYTISLGGLRYIDPATPTALPIDVGYDLPIIVGYTSRSSTTAELVQKVKRLKDRNEKLFNKLLNAIEDVVKEALRAFLNHDLETLGALMNLNHGLLQAMGVVDYNHNRLHYALREAGALGVKTSGAGGGGAFIALAPSNDVKEKLALVANALGAKVVSMSICPNGVKILKS